MKKWVVTIPDRLTISPLVSAILLAGMFITAGKTSHAMRWDTNEQVPAAYLPIIKNHHPVSPSIFGAHMDTISVTNGLAEMVAANSYWARRDIYWGVVQPAENLWNWPAVSNLEKELIAGSGKGMEIIMVVGNTPPWALKDGYSCGAVAEDKLVSLVDFIDTIVTRYSQPPYNIKYWELWNEPDTEGVLGCWGDPTDSYYGGEYYADMLEVVYPVIKAADPQAQVLVGGLLLNCAPQNTGNCVGQDGILTSKFLEGILVHNGLNDGGDYFDGVSFHAYDFYSLALGRFENTNWQSTWMDGPVLIAKSRFIKQLLSDYGYENKQILSTENAILCDVCLDNPEFELTKAYYLTQSFASAIAEGVVSNIWFKVLGWRNSGLLYPDLQHRPAYTAFKTARDQLGKAQFVREIMTYPGLRVLEFNNRSRQIWVVWPVSSSPSPLIFGDSPDSIFDALGNALNPSNPIYVTAPIYLIWNP